MQKEGGVTDQIVHEILQAFVNYAKIMDKEKDTKIGTYVRDGWNDIANKNGLPQVE